MTNGTTKKSCGKITYILTQWFSTFLLEQKQRKNPSDLTDVWSHICTGEFKITASHSICDFDRIPIQAELQLKTTELTGKVNKL